jgi:hypothetical protein
VEAVLALARDRHRSRGPSRRTGVQLHRQLVCTPDHSGGDANLRRYTYPGAVVNVFVAAGLIYLHHRKSEGWSSPWHTFLPVSVLFLLSNLFLTLVPFIPPGSDWNADGYPYYVFPVVGFGVLIFGAIYWIGWTKIWPKLGGYRIVAERSVGQDGVEVVRYRKIRD